MEPCRIVSARWDVDRRLADLGLTRKMILAATRRGISAFASCTRNHPVSFAGTSLWAEAVCGLAEETAASGFRRIDDGGQPLIIHMNGDLAFTVATGDERTGLTGVNAPATKSSKGPRTVEAVRRNSMRFLFEEMEADEKARIVEEARINRAMRNTWFLLIYFDPESGVSRCELSLPSHMDDQQHIDEWAERIIIGEVPFGDGARTRRDESGEPHMTGEIIVEIKRRA